LTKSFYTLAFPAVQGSMDPLENSCLLHAKQGIIPSYHEQ